MTPEQAARDTLAHGGGTYAALTLDPVTPTSGYAVGLVQGTAIVSYATPAAMAAGIRTVASFYSHAAYIGTWVDNGRVHIDPVAIIPDRESALTLARALGQLAVWDFATGTEIEVTQ